jgi:DNA (cytosine-5)-methyltransferase 1
MAPVLKAISLFSGAGGMDVGLRKAGIESIASVELDKNCVETLRNNCKSRIFHSDIRELDPKAVLRSLAIRSIDVIHGGPPCQPFSQIGAQKGLGHKDGMLLFEMIRWIGALKPKIFIIEQVKGLLKHQETLAHLTQSLDSIGYRIDVNVLNSSDYGVAQMRERVIIVGSLEKQPSIMNSIRKKPRLLTVGSVIDDLPKLGGHLFHNHIDVTPARDRERISYVKEGEWLSKSIAPKDIILGLTKKDTTKYRRLDRSLPSLTLRCGEIFYHPTTNRYLTPREYMRIHGYPDSYVLSGPIRSRTGQVSNLDQHRQVANSVPPPMACAIGKAVVKNFICQ